MGIEDLLERPLNAGGNRIANVGAPREPGDVTLVDGQSAPLPLALLGAPGQSLLAAAADHVHPLPLAVRVLASGSTRVAGRSVIELAEVERRPGELLLPSGLVWIEDDLPLSWSGGFGLPPGPPVALIATWHQRGQRPRAVSFMVANRSVDPVHLTWASVAYVLPPSP